MLNGKFALALAAAMVLATLYGCSSSGGIKNDRDEARTQVEELTVDLATANGVVATLQNQIFGEGGTAAMPTADSLMGMLAASGTSNTGLMNRIYGDGGTAEMPTADSLMGMLAASGMSNTGLMNQIYGDGGTAEMPTDDSLMGRLAASGMSNTGLMNQIYGDGGTAEMPTDDSLMGRLAASGMSNTGLMNQIYGDGGTAEMPTDDSLMGRLAASGMSNTGLMNQIYGDGGTAEMPTDDSLMGRLAASGMGNTGLMNQIYGDGGTAEMPTDDSLMGRLAASGMSNTALMNRIYGDGGTAEMPTDDSLMGRLAASGMGNTGLMNQIYGDGGTAEMPTDDSLMGRLAASGMSNTALMNRIYGDGGTAEMPTDDSLMGRLAASGMSNTALMNRIYGDGGTAEMPIAGSLMAEVTRLGNIANDGDGDGENDAVTLLNGRVAGFETAAASTVGAVNAGNAATTALGDATDKSGKIDARSPTVVGDSRMAQANAQAVLDAQRNAKGAVITAQTAVNNAKAALAADADPEDSLTKALNAAITVAEDNLKTAMTIADGKALKDAVELVTGDNPDAEDYPMTPAKHGKEVAMAIGGALGPTSPEDGSRMRGDHETTDTNVPADAVSMNNHVGSTWEEIVGAANIKQMRIATAEDDTNVVSAASIAGQATSSVNMMSDLEADGGLGNGKQHDGTYKGIPGTVFCAGTDCAVTMTDDGETLTGSWYFNPNNEDEWYVRNAADTAYMVETLYARFGHWLAANSTTPANTDVNTYAVGGTANTNTGNLDVTMVNTGADATTLTDTKATYEGMAAGMALHKQFDSSGIILEGSLRSTAFTADVELTATFGVGATLGGEITDFEDTAGKDIDPSWEVELLTRSFDGNTFADGTAVASAQDGEWTAQAFGVDGDRPTGVFGGFNAHFTNGHVAGAYATRK